MNSKTPEERIKDAIDNVAIAQPIIALANKEGANLIGIAALLENAIDTNQITQWLQDRTNLNGVATLLDQGVESPVITQLINNQADLRDIATNAQLLLNRSIRVDLVSGWLKNGTHLNNAIAIMRLGVELNRIGTSSTVGNFIGLTGATPDEIVSRIPENAKIEEWIPVLVGMSERRGMDIVKDVKEILKERNPHEKQSGSEKLGDVFECGQDLSQGDVAEGVQLLLAAALQEDDQDVQESFFHTINNAVVYQYVGSRIDWDTLATSLSSLGKWELEYALDVLGMSGKAKYLPILEEYAHHADPEIREWAQEAITEREYRIAHAPVSQKEAV